MNKLLLVLLLLMLLLIVACRGRGSSWQPSSATAPQLGEQPNLLLRPRVNFTYIEMVSPNVQQLGQERQALERAPALGPLLAADYQRFADILIGEGGQYVDLPNGSVAPNGLWVTSTRDTGLYLSRIDGVEMLLAMDGQAPVWSSDSQWLAYIADNTLWVVDMHNLSLRQIIDVSGEPLSWSADSQQLLLRNGEDAIVFDLVTNAQQTLRGVDATQFHDQPVWSTDGATIFARYGDNGKTDAIPERVQARLVAIEVGDGRSNLRDLLPNVRNQGITTFMPSPDRAAILVRYHVCRNEFGGLFPFIPTRVCDNSHVLVESATGNYRTLPTIPANTLLTWEQSLPAVALADLPMPDTSGAVAAGSGQLDATTFWQPDAPLGQNPATAVPFGQAQVNGAAGKLLSVLEVVTGEAALELVVNAAGPQPLPGYTYIAVHQRITRETGRSSLFQTPGTRLVDTSRVAHREILWLNAGGEVIDELEYSAAAPAEYWQVFAVAEGAQPWLLFESAGVADNLPDLYFRLDERAEWTLPAGAAFLQTNTVGVSEPAQLGEPAVSAAWQVTLLESQPTGLAATDSNLIKVRIAYTGSAPSAARLFTCLSERNLAGVAATQIGGPRQYRNQPLQSIYHQPCLLPGGTYEGWFVAIPEVAGGASAFRFVPPTNANDPFNSRTFEK